MHEHNKCEHELVLCKICDIVYCKRCHQEWGRYIHVYPWVWGYRNPYWIYTSGTSAIPFNATSQTDTGNMLAQNRGDI